LPGFAALAEFRDCSALFILVNRAGKSGGVAVVHGFDGLAALFG